MSPFSVVNFSTMHTPHLTGADVRRLARSGELTGPTPGLALGYVQANLVVVPRDLAFDFLLFCQRNPKPCPLLDVTEPGSPEAETDSQRRGRIFVPTCTTLLLSISHGELARPSPLDLKRWWRRLIWLPSCWVARSRLKMPCSRQAFPIRHIEQRPQCADVSHQYSRAVPPASFHGPHGRVDAAVDASPGRCEQRRICARFPRAHGMPPFTFGDPAKPLASADLDRPDYRRPGRDSSRARRRCSGRAA